MSTTTTKRTTAGTKAGKAEAEAKAKAEASIAATAAAIVAEAGSAEAKLTDAVTKATTKAEALTAATDAVRYVIATEADAFGRIVFGRQTIGAALYRAYHVIVKANDENETVKAAADVTFTALAAKVFGLSKDEYEALTDRKRPMPRSWSALAEDWALYVNTADGRWRAAYDASIGDATPTVRGYKTFAKRANDAEASEAEAKGTPQSRGAVTKAKALAEAKRQVAAEAKAKADALKVKRDAADKAITHATTHPAASIVAGFPALSGRDLTSCYDVDTLDAVIHAVTAWRDHVKAMTADELKAAKVAAGIDEVTEAAVADVAAVTEAEAEAPEMAAPSAEVLAAAAAMLADMMAATK
jgi:trimeric autotransporter adhesin